MDVWFCRVQEPMPRGTLCLLNILEMMTCTLSRACLGHPVPRLTDDLHGCRQSGSNPIAGGANMHIEVPEKRRFG